VSFDDDELEARVAARQVRETVHTGSFVLLGVGLLIAIAVATMLVVAW
jgi:ABC-type lipoprotein release transport system permease subunit